MLGNISLKAKLIGLCGFLATFTAVLGGVFYFTITNISATYEHVTSINMANGDLLARMRADLKDMRTGVRGYAMVQSTEEVREFARKLATDAIADFELERAKYEKVPFVEGEDAKWGTVLASWKLYRPIVEKLFQVRIESGEAAGQEYMEIIHKEERPVAATFTAELSNLITFQDTEALKWITTAESSATAGKATAGFMAFGAFLAAMVIGTIFSSKLVSQLRDIASKLETGSGEVASASNQISEAGAELSASATEQAAALQETVSSIDEVSAMVSKNSENAFNSQRVATSSTVAVNRGKLVVGEMLHSIDEINGSNTDIMTQSEASNQEIASIVKIISEIGNKTKVINDIVFQTKLLSFNASVEAARAGEHGKGFAVVAEEVGSLAQMSGNAAKEISQLLEDSIKKVEATVVESRTKIERLINKGKERIETGLSTAKRCGEVFDEIVTSVTEVGGMVGEIATASKEQAQGVQEITKAMGQMDQVTQQNASAAQQSASAAEQLTGQAAILHDMVETLLATVNGANSGAPRPQHTQAVAANRKATAPKGKNNVVPLRKKNAHLSRSGAAEGGSAAVKKAVGTEMVPSENDPRFEDA